MQHQPIHHDRRASDIRETAPVPASAEAEMVSRFVQFARLSPLAAIELALRGEVQ